MSWKDDKGLGPWKFEKATADNRYNEGDRITDSKNPVWSMDKTGIPISTRHDPCGYWYGKEPPPTQPIVRYTLYSCGRYGSSQLGRAVGDNNIFLPMDDTSHFYKVDLGNSNGLYIKHDRSLWGLGQNASGHLGTGDKVTLTSLTQIGTDKDWESVSLSGQHALALKSDGSIWSCGANANGELGQGDNVERLVLTQIGAEYDWKYVFANTYASFAIKNSGQLYSWGGNVNGDLGQGNNTEYKVPTKVEVNGTGFDSLSGSDYSVVGLKSGKIWSCGYNVCGQLCLDNTTSTNVFVSRSANETWDKVHCGGSIAGWSLLVKNGTLWSVGNNGSGQLGFGDLISKTIVTQVDSATDWWQVGCDGSYTYSYALKTNGKLYSCGSNQYGQLGLGSQLAQGPKVFTEVGGTWGTVICGDSHVNIGKAVYYWE